MDDHDKDTWAGVLLAVLMVAMLLGGLLILRLTGNLSSAGDRSHGAGIERLTTPP